jgi:hypothetical protein
VFSGVQAGFAYVPTTGANTQTNAGVKYANGPLTVSYTSSKNVGGTAGTDADEIAGSYNLGPALLRVGQTVNKSASAANITETGYGVEVPMGAMTLGAAYANNAGGTSGQKNTALQARYALSKNTTLMAKYLSKDASGTKTNGSFYGMQIKF